MGNRKENYYKQKKNRGRFKKKQLKEVAIQESKNLKDDTCTVAATSDKNISELIIDEATRVPFQEIQNIRDSMPSAHTSSERNTPQLFIEEAQDNEEFKVDGRRVIDFMYFYEELHKIAKHNSPLGCNFSHLQLIKEQKKGFYSKFTFLCKMCNIELHVMNCKLNKNSKDLNLNETAVSSFMSIGAGYVALEQVSASLGIPCMSKNLYVKCHTKVCELWELAKQKSMEEAAKEEYDLAIQNGDVDANGVPMITFNCGENRMHQPFTSQLLHKVG
ncbi:unnamed protein product [Arctia plantaginis]|uniref:Mutator-like transposase domain-containing protein n=1 Tax=Arctia plantaginis TaxID=874455 RepID=A0A8S1AM84_ARCPL|nr:unnamed protein product [Arctia plantaginis]